MSDDPPILRSPPFPGVPPHIAAVSLPAAGATGDSREDDLLAALRAARVGGTFWAAPFVPPPESLLVSVTTAAHARTLIARAELEPGIVALLPDAAWAMASAASLRSAGIACHIGPFDPWTALPTARAIEVEGGDELALLGLIAGTKVRCTSTGRFAGHGMTDDAPGISLGPPLALAALTARTLLAGVRYRDCFTGDDTDVLGAIALLAEWRALIDRNRGITVGAGIALWKRREVSRMLWNGTAPLRFARTTARALRLARGGGTIAAWPSRVEPGLPAASAAAGVPLGFVEDGFIRSIGLGSNLHPPLSIVADRSGIYYDPRGSDLETLLATHPFPPALVARARLLAAEIVRAGLSKYSVGAEPFAVNAGGRRIVLVAGQVEDDLSVRLGGGTVAGNRDLLARARAAEPDAYILFKPHPDVDAGHRAGRIADADALRLADRVVRGVSMAALFGAVDAVHVLTSLAGYEALLRGREVIVHGSPFYAGWGLTRDLGPPLPARTRRLTIDQLTAAALILYPRYLDPVTGLPCTPEMLVARLRAQTVARPTALIQLRMLQGWLRQALKTIGRPE